MQKSWITNTVREKNCTTVKKVHQQIIFQFKDFPKDIHNHNLTVQYQK